MRRALIAGMGKTGYSCANFLAAHQIEFSVTDSRDMPPMLQPFKQSYPDVRMSLGDFDLSQLEDIEMLVVSPGIPMETDLIKQAMLQNKDVVGDIELFARFAQAPIVAITGSNGKSTVTTLLGEMIKEAGLRVEVGGNLGVPALDLLQREVPDYYVLEVSSFQLDLIQKLPTAASVVLNVSPDHMDRYANLDDYISSKLKIYRYANVCVINKDDKRINGMAAEKQAVIAFTAAIAEEGEFAVAQYNDELCLTYGKTPMLSVSELKLYGKHNYINVAACFALGHSIGLSHSSMVAAAKKFSGLAHRCELIAEYEGVKWFNDSKATNVAAANASILSMPGNVVLIAGGVAKDTDFSLLIETVKEKVKAVVLIGRDASLLESVMRGSAELIHADGMRQAVAQAKRVAQTGDTVLLAPACASFDMYQNYEARGNDFVACAKDVLGR